MKYKIAVLSGILLAGAGLFLLRCTPEFQGILQLLPYLCIGVGCGCFGHGAGELLSRRALKNDPTLQKQLEIQKTTSATSRLPAVLKPKPMNVSY